MVSKDTINKIVVWALYDSGNSCYQQAINKYYNNQIEVYSIGIDKENKNGNFLYLNLADYSELFGSSELFKALDNLPYPHIILASPPCESWSNATAMKDGNASWYTQRMQNLFGEMKGENNFTIRTKKQIEAHNRITTFKKYWWKVFYNRINGELCTFNTVRIIEKYQPIIWVIENPQTSKMWDYLEYIHDFEGIKNVAHYSAYNDSFSKKPTVFYSNIHIPVKTTKMKAKVIMSSRKGDKRKTLGRSYNIRSNIPLELIRDILNTCINRLNQIGEVSKK